MIAILFTLHSCETNLGGIMSSDDIEALQAMETSYAAAAESNSSLADYIETTGITNDQICLSFDKVFHDNDSIFEANHMKYSHNNSGDNHSSGSWSMGSGWMSGNGNQTGSGSMMGKGGMMGFNSNFCTSGNLNLMDSLMNTHEAFHPEN